MNNYRKVVKSELNIEEYEIGDIVRFCNPLACGLEWDINFYKHVKGCDFEVVGSRMETSYKEYIAFGCKFTRYIHTQFVKLKDVNGDGCICTTIPCSSLYKSTGHKLRNDLDDFNYTNMDDMILLFEKIKAMNKKDLQEHMLRFGHTLYSERHSKPKVYKFIETTPFGDVYMKEKSKSEMIDLLQDEYLKIANKYL